MEGRGYRDRYFEFEALGVEVVGVGFTPPEVNLEWCLADGLPFELWEDTDRALSMAWGAIDSPEQAQPDRMAALVDAEGVWTLWWPEQAAGEGVSPNDVLADLYLLYGG